MEELSKGQEKIAHKLIDEALQRECAKFLNDMDSFMRQRNQNEEDSHKTYLSLFRKIHQFDKKLTKRYDGLTGSAYFLSVIGLYCDGVLTDEDINQFEEEIQVRIRLFRDSLE